MPTPGRLQSNQWIRHEAAKITGRVLSIGSRDDSDGVGGRYRDYFVNASAYVTSEPEAEFNCDLLIDVRAMPQIESESWDAIFCSGVLEHVDRVDDAVAEMARVLKPGGTLLVGVPFRQAIHCAPQDFWRFTAFGLKFLLEKHDFVLADIASIQEDVPRFPVSYWARALRRLRG
jgi:SAM-dependent methyltransferase